MRVVLSFSGSLSQYFHGEFTPDGTELWFVGCHELLFSPEEEERLKNEIVLFRHQYTQDKLEVAFKAAAPFIETVKTALKEGRFFGRRGPMPGTVDYPGIEQMLKMVPGTLSEIECPSNYHNRADVLIRYGHEVIGF